MSRTGSNGSSDSVEVFGCQFLAGAAAAGAALLFDEDTVARGIPAGRDGRRLTREQSVVTVPGRDRPR